MDYTKKFDPKDLIIQSYSSTYRNDFGSHRIPNGIRVIHLPTGTVIYCDEHRSQYKNRHTALTQLQEQVQGKPSYTELLVQVNALKELASFWIRQSEPKNCTKQEYNTWLALGFHSDAMKADPQKHLHQIQAEVVLEFAKQYKNKYERVPATASLTVVSFANEYANSVKAGK